MNKQGRSSHDESPDMWWELRNEAGSERESAWDLDVERNVDRGAEEERVPHAPAEWQQRAVGGASTPDRHRSREETDASETAIVLVAEDDGPIAEAVALVLEDANYASVIAANGQLALEVARAHWPILVITDLMMPRMGGLELIAALHAHADANGHPMPPVVLLTAAQTLVRRGDFGINAVVHKPFDISTLEVTVRRLLGTPSPE